MTSLNSIVQVNIDRQTSPITVAGFSLPMFLGLHKGFTERYREYASPTEVAVDFSTDSNEYKAALSYFGQEISVNKIAIGRRDSTIVTYTPVAQNSTSYVVKINTSTFTFVSDADATPTEIVTGLTALINAGSEPVTASGTTTLILTADVLGVAFSAKASTNLTPVYTTTESLTDALTAVQLESDDWYGVNAYSHVKADIIEVAAWTQAAEKLYATSSTDLNIVNQTLLADTTSVAVALKDAGYDRTMLFYSADAAKFPEAALFGGQFTRDGGKATWMFKQLSGITVDRLTTTQKTNALAKNANIYTTVGGINITSEGKTSEGTFADIIRDLDIYKSRLQVSVYSRFANLPKIPFTDEGIAIIEGAIRAETLRAVQDGILANDPAPVITVPKALDVSTNDRALRKLTGVTIEARIAGAIHSTIINVTATV